MEPHERIRYTFYNLHAKLLMSIGHNYLQKNRFKPHLYTYFMYLVNAVGFTSCIYTIICYDASTALNSIGYGAVNIQLVAKILLMRYAHLLISLINRTIAIYEVNVGTKSRSRALLLRNMSWLSEVILIGGTIAYMNCVALHFINPIYGYFWHHEYKPLFPLYVPFVDERTAIGFAILVAIQSIEIFAALISSGCADFHFMITVVNIWIFTSIFHDDVHELSKLLHRKQVDLARAMSRNIFNMYYDIYRLIDDINTVYFMNTFVVILCAAVATIMELFTCMTIGLIPASCLAGIFLFQIIGYCGIGTIVELCNNKMIDALIDCDWYLLPIDEQMKFKFLVMHVGMSKTLTLGGIRPLNMESCVSILKTIYSYVMLLHRVIE